VDAQRRLTLNLGLRYAWDRGFVPPQCRQAGDFAAAGCFDEVDLPIFNTFAPRVHLSYDMFGNGKTVLKGGWGRFDHMREITPEVDSLNRVVATTTTYAWHDLNGNKAYEPGEVNLDPNGPDYVSIAGTTAAVPNPDEKQPKVDEFSASFERELGGKSVIRVTGVYSRNFNTYRLLSTYRPYEAYNIPIRSLDPGPDGRVGTSDDPGKVLTYYDYSPDLRGLQFEQTTLINPPGNEHTYKSIEVAASRRLSNRWRFLASYSATRSHIPAGAGTGNAVAFNPNAEINILDDTWEWLGKLSGAYIFKYDITASANYERRSGLPQAR